MSIEYLNLVFAVALKGAKKTVLIALADRANQAGYCCPSMDDIAFRSGCSKRNAIRAVSELEKSGFITVIRVTGKANKYFFVIDKLFTARDTTSPGKDIHNSDTTSLPNDTVSPDPCHGVTQTIKNHHLTKEKRARGNQTHSIVTNAQAYKLYHPVGPHRSNKKTVQPIKIPQDNKGKYKGQALLLLKGIETAVKSLNQAKEVAKRLISISIEVQS